MTKKAKWHTFIDTHDDLWVVDIKDLTIAFHPYKTHSPTKLTDLIITRGPIKHVWSTTKEGEYV